MTNPATARPLVALLAIFTVSAPLTAENWPAWRGPRGDGTSAEKGLPVVWSDAANVAWRVALPGAAGATPVVWNDRIFLTSARGEELVLIALSTAGELLWTRKLGQGNQVVREDEGNSASPSPVTDGAYVWALAGTGDLACHDFAGTETWRANLQDRYGKYDFWFGMASTPLLDGDRLYLMCLQMKDSYVLALDKTTGAEVWKVPRDTDADYESKHSYASPVLYQDAELRFLLVHGGDYLTAHRLADGSEIWRAGGLNPKSDYNRTLRFIASPACSPGLIVAPSAKEGPIVSLKPGGKGDVTETHRLWRRPRDTPDVSTPAIHDGLVYLVRKNGVLLCLRAETGEQVYIERTHDRRHRASPVVADGKVYVTARDGMVTVVKAGEHFEVLAKNGIGEPISASPAISNGTIYLRTFMSLIAIRNAPAAGIEPASGK